MAGRTSYLALLRGINVGGKNKVPMAELRSSLEGLGLSDVSTYIASGNVMFESTRGPARLKAEIERALPQQFSLDSDLVAVLILTHDELRAIVEEKPAGFGEQPSVYHSDVIFLIDLEVSRASRVFNPREGVDRIWPGTRVIYSQRLSAERTKSRLSAIAGTPEYRSMTIRSWTTTTKLLALMDARASD